MVEYLYVEPTTDVVPSLTAETESKWRKEGHVVKGDWQRPGIWLFGDVDHVGAVRSSINEGSLTGADTSAWKLKEEGNYEPGALYKASRTGISVAVHQGSTSANQENTVRQSQSQNVRASAVNPSQIMSGQDKPASLVAKSADEAATTRIVHELYISAVLGSATMHLCRSLGAIQINARTLVLVPRNAGLYHPQGNLTVISVDVQLTAQCTLTLKTSSKKALGMGCFGSQSHISALLHQTATGIPVFLGPTGHVGSCLGIDLAVPDSPNNTTPETPTERSMNTKSIDSWKKKCIKFFQRNGISTDLLELCPWVSVQICLPAERSDAMIVAEDTWLTVQWPAPLCFFNKRLAQSTAKQLHKLKDYDPLSFAETWMMQKAERDATSKKLNKEKDVANMVGKTSVDTSSPSLLMPSSQNYRRSSITGAIYPTPPDGIQQNIAATPSFEGSSSTPGPSQLLMASDTVDQNTDQNIISKDDIEEMEAQPWSSGVQRKDSATMNLEFQDHSTDGLFEDMDADLFGENDVTDADFSFFDEPDALPRKNEMTQIKESHDVDDPPYALDIDPNDDPIFDSLGLDEKTPIGIPSDHLSNEGTSEEEKPALDPHQPDTAPEIDIFTNKIVDPPPRTISPPLNPEEVFKKLSSMGISSQAKNVKIETSAFGGLNFNPSLPSFTSKYGSQGRFVSPIAPRLIPRSASIALPKTEYMNKRRKRNAVAGEHLTPITPDFASSNFSSPWQRTRRNSQSDIESDASSPDASDQDDTSDTSNDGLDSSALGQKRKRDLIDEPSDHDDNIRSSLQSLQVEAEKKTTGASIQGPDNEKILEIDPAGWSLDMYFRLLKPEGHLVSFEDAEFVAIAQTLAEQAISSVFQVDGLTENSIKGARIMAGDEGDQDNIRQSMATMLQDSLGKLTECTLTNFSDIQDGANVSQHRLPPRPIPNNPRIGQLPEPPRSIFPIGAPHLEVSRADSKLTVIPAAIPFWDNLSLGPAKGPKDVCAVCIHPRGHGLFDNVKAFLDHIGSTYETNHFGSHERFSTADFSYDLTPSSFLDPLALSSADQLTAPTFPSLQEINTRLGSELTATSLKEKNFVIYYLYDPSTPEVLVHICSAFHNLFELYKASFVAAKTPITNDLVLQLVPINFVASTTALAVPSVEEYSNLAMEVYDRCVDLKSGTASPAIILEKPLLRIIDFKLTASPSASLMQENSVIHVSYAQSVDERWITAAWTDNLGSMQYSASYSLGRRNVTTALSSIQAEIWDTTLGIISCRKVNWRVMIACCGVMQQHEIEFWKSLAAIDSNAQVSVTLLTVDTDPSLQLMAPSVSIPPSTLTAQISLHSTPVSTPQASILSPEQAGNAATPARDTAAPAASTPTDQSDQPLGPEALLIDVREQSWGCVLSHRLNNSRCLLDIHPALISGYLIKRGGTAANDIPILMEINIVHSDVNPRLYEALLREILLAYRGLGTLARVRGRMGKGKADGKDIRPWHVAVAEKGVDVLYTLM